MTDEIFLEYLPKKVNFIFILYIRRIVLNRSRFKDETFFPINFASTLYCSACLMGIILGVSLHLEYGASLFHTKSASGSDSRHDVACRNSVTSAQYVTSSVQA